MAKATETTKRYTKVIHPDTKQVVEVTGRWKRTGPRGRTYISLRVTGGCHFDPAALEIVA